jgi:hypothetical protein
MPENFPNRCAWTRLVFRKRSGETGPTLRCVVEECGALAAINSAGKVETQKGHCLDIKSACEYMGGEEFGEFLETLKVKYPGYPYEESSGN